MNFKMMLLAGAIGVTVAANQPAEAQRSVSGVGRPGVSTMQLPAAVRNLINKSLTMSAPTLTAECEVLQASKTAWKPPYYPYRTGAIRFKMTGTASSSLYVNLYGNPSPGVTYGANIPQPDQSAQFAAGKSTMGIANEPGFVVVMFETTPLSAQTMSPVHVNLTGPGLSEIIDSSGGGTGMYVWNGSLTCPVG